MVSSPGVTSSFKLFVQSNNQPRIIGLSSRKPGNSPALTCRCFYFLVPFISFMTRTVLVDGPDYPHVRDLHNRLKCQTVWVLVIKCGRRQPLLRDRYNTITQHIMLKRHFIIINQLCFSHPLDVRIKTTRGHKNLVV